VATLAKARELRAKELVATLTKAMELRARKLVATLAKARELRAREIVLGLLVDTLDCANHGAGAGEGASGNAGAGAGEGAGDNAGRRASIREQVLHFSGTLFITRDNNIQYPYGSFCSHIKHRQNEHVSLNLA
jgi:hypothetical protein